MGRYAKRRSGKTGLPPGTLVHIGDERKGIVKVTVIDYDEKQLNEKKIAKVEDCFPFKDKPTVTWINVDGIHDTEAIEKIGGCFNFHPLILEDIVSTEQRPKLEDYGDYLFIVVKMLYFDEKQKEIQSEQVSLVLGSNFVISFQEKEGDIFDPIRERIRNSKGRIRRMGADYLAYALVDAIVDNYFLILEKTGESVEDLEEELVRDPTPDTMQVIHKLKRDMIFLRKTVWPLREVISTLERGESRLINKTTRVYLRDVYDHTIQVIDTIETLRDMISGMLDIYLSSISNRMNEVMKVLTIIATIFIPLTFITGIYGMNFNPSASPLNMPELDWYWGYPSVLVVMAAVAVVMSFYFKKRRWL